MKRAHRTRGKQHNDKTMPALATMIGCLLGLAACQTTQPQPAARSYGNTQQADPYNPYYGRGPGASPAAPHHGGQPAHASWPIAAPTGAWVEDVSDQDAFNPPPGAAPATGHPAPSPTAPRTHVVRPGETLWRLSKQYGTTVDAIRVANGIPGNSNTIVSGTTLRIP